MTEISDLSDTDALNTEVSGETISGNTNMTRTDDVFHAVLGMLSRWRNARIFRLRDDDDNSKQVAFDLSEISASTTRTLTIPDKSGRLALVDDELAWLSFPIGMPFPLFTHLDGVAVPPTDSPDFRFIKLTAGDVYNDTVLTNESVSGSAPLVVATADISDPLSPMDGETIHLINTERRVLRAGMSGVVQEDAFQGHHHETEFQDAPGSYLFRYGSGGTSNGGPSGNNSNARLRATTIISDGTNGASRVANETRAKNIGADYFMRIR